MRKIFLDFGTHKGEGLLEFFYNGTIDDSFEVHTFEPTPGLGTEADLEGFKKGIPGFPQNIIFYNKAVWTKDGVIIFNNRMDHGSHIVNIGFSCDQKEEDFNKVRVESVDISKFIKDLPESEIICKMDIEGSEFPVLRYLIYTGALKRIKEIYIEFHPKLMENESFMSMNFLIEEIKNLGPKVILWH